MADNKYIVVDNFCDVPEKVVEEVYAAGIGTWTPEKGEIGSSIYEGMGFWGPHAVLLAPLVDAMRTLIVPNSMFFRITNVGMEKAYIHSARESGAYTAIVYLTEHDQPSGTAFYRHKPTGLIEMPSFADMRAMGRPGKELQTDMVTRDPDKWEQTDYVEGKYNRALIFDAPLFHSRFPVDGIGDSEETGRLIWASHFYKLDGNGVLY